MPQKCATNHDYIRVVFCFCVSHYFTQILKPWQIPVQTWTANCFVIVQKTTKKWFVMWHKSTATLLPCSRSMWVQTNEYSPWSHSCCCVRAVFELCAFVWIQLKTNNQPPNHSIVYDSKFLFFHRKIRVKLLELPAEDLEWKWPKKFHWCGSNPQRRIKSSARDHHIPEQTLRWR